MKQRISISRKTALFLTSAFILVSVPLYLTAAQAVKDVEAAAVTNFRPDIPGPGAEPAPADPAPGHTPCLYVLSGRTLAWAGVTLALCMTFLCRAVLVNQNQARCLRQSGEDIIYTEASVRKDTARKIHGTVAQTLGITLSRVRGLRENSAGGETLAEIETLLEQGVREVRSVIDELSPPVLDDFDMDVALDFLVDEYNERHHAAFNFTNGVGGALPMTLPRKMTCYNAVRTILANILKQPSPPVADVDISAAEGFLEVRIRTPRIKKVEHLIDSGTFHPDLPTRLRRLGGQIETRSGSDRSGIVMIRIPAGGLS